METNEAETNRRRPNTSALASGSRPAKQSKQVSSSGLPANAGSTTGNIQPNEVQQVMGLTGTGAEQASGGASSEGLARYMIERPISLFGTLTNTYTKSHKFMTFGLAPNVIPVPFTAGTPPLVVGKSYYLSTYLAEIPWHIPALYMTSSEFNILPSGTHVTELNVQVIYRGSTIQFQTNQTTTALATLNQINDIAVAYALNKSGQGHNVNYRSFDATQPMVPLTLAKPIYGPVTGYRGMVRDYYGSQQADGYTLFEGDIPKHQLGRQTFLYNYWNMCLNGPATPAEPNTLMNGGWPMLADKIEQLDGKTCVNQLIAEMTYSPKNAPLNGPQRTISHGIPNTTNNTALTIPVNGLRTVMENSIQTQDAGPIDTLGFEITSSASQHDPTNNIGNLPTLDIFTPIEKSQYVRSGPWGENANPHVQPSLHVGVQPTPALTTSQLLTDDATFNAWTDTRAYWEVIATMKIAVREETKLPYGSTANVPIGEMLTFGPSANRPIAITNPKGGGR